MTNKEIAKLADELKKARVQDSGCDDCGLGRGTVPDQGFERFWEDELSYEPRRYAFKYIDPGASDVPVSKMKSLHYDLNQVQDAMNRCVILCRGCYATRERNEQCKDQATWDSPPDLSRTSVEALPD